VRREVVEVVTPGSRAIRRRSTRRRARGAALWPGPPGIGLAVLDASTGDLRATALDCPASGGAARPRSSRSCGALRRARSCFPDDAALDAALARALPDAARRRVGREGFDGARAPRHPDGLRADARIPASRAAAALLDYVGRHQPFALAQIARLRRYALSDAMVLDAATRSHLELFRNAEDGSRARTLIARIDETRTPLGARRLARWLAYPLVDPAAIRARQAAVAFLAERDRLRARVREALRPVRDLERLLAKAARPGRDTARPARCALARGAAGGRGGVRRRGEELLGDRAPRAAVPSRRAARRGALARSARGRGAAAAARLARRARNRLQSARGSTPNWMGFAKRSTRAASGSPDSRPRSARAPGSRRSRSASTRSTATGSR
jgi:hypothetical protein